MGRDDEPDRLVVHLDWHTRPPRRRLDRRLPPTEPGSPERLCFELEGRLRAGIQAHVAAGWQLDGEAQAAVTYQTRRRQVLLPVPGVAGPVWEEYVGADVRLRRAGVAVHDPASL